MRDSVLHYICEHHLLRAGDRVAVAVSGGADSVALLRILLDLRAELGIVLAVAHFNHQLRGDDSDADGYFVAELATEHDLLFFASRADVRGHAAANRLSVEHAARELRYQWLLELARDQRFDAIATAHTADDQAETVLMKFLRGAGTRGLAGIHPILVRDDVRIVRPLLEVSRVEIEQYVTSIKQPWREDESNRDRRLTRNRIRHDLLPLLEQDYNPNLRRLLSQTAEVARAEEDFWRASVEPDFAARRLQSHTFLLPGFDRLHVSLQRRLLKRFLEFKGIPADFHHVESLRRCALGEAPRLDLARGWVAIRSADCLTITQPSQAESAAGYNYTVAIPGKVHVIEVPITISATIVQPESALRFDPGTLLRADSIGRKLTIRNWQPGDRFRPAHTASAEKLKRLFAEKRIPAGQRRLWPVALRGPQIIWVRGLPVSHDFSWVPGSGDAVKIEVIQD